MAASQDTEPHNHLRPPGACGQIMNPGGVVTVARIER